MENSLGPSPTAIHHPDHTIRISNEDRCWRVTVNGTRVAYSCDTLALDEAHYKRVIYFPPNDVRIDLLLESDTRTTCPFKGEAHYLTADFGSTIQDIAWFYPAVYDEVRAIEGYIAFYTDRVTLSSQGGVRGKQNSSAL